MRKGATTLHLFKYDSTQIVALRNEKGSYNFISKNLQD